MPARASPATTTPARAGPRGRADNRGVTASTSATPAELATGLWTWAAPHPEWRPEKEGDAKGFGNVVNSFALVAGDELLLVDPLLPDDEAPVLAQLDALAAGRQASILITIGYHVRSAEQLASRYGASLWGPQEVRSRLTQPETLQVHQVGEPGPGGAVAYEIGRPPHGERPLWLPSHQAVAFGDAVIVTPAGEPRVWADGEDLDEQRLAFYRGPFAASFAPLLEQPIERLLISHGEPVLLNGAEALTKALAADPWNGPFGEGSGT